MARVSKKRNFKIKKSIKAGICRIIEDTVACNEKIHCRGVCPRHHTYFLRWKTMDKYAVKQKFAYVEKSKYKINKKAAANKCHIIENGKNCTRLLHGRHLCARHWLSFERHNLLEKYGTASRKDPRTFRLKKKIVKGVCRMNENNKNCNNKVTSRGLCSKHYLRFLRDGQIKKFAVKKS